MDEEYQALLDRARKQIPPEVFEHKDDEKAGIVEEFQSGGPDKGEIRDDLTSCAQEAEESCPVEVIHVG